MALVDENYRDDSELREQDIVDVERYLSMRDRAPANGRGAPFFSGREAEIGAFREMTNSLSQGLAANASIVVQGPPGVGKSALMCQFMEEMRSLPPTATGGRRWLPVSVSAGDAESPPYLADAIDAAIVSRLAADLLAPGSAEATLLERLGDYWGKLEPAKARARASDGPSRRTITATAAASDGPFRPTITAPAAAGDCPSRRTITAMAGDGPSRPTTSCG